MAHCHEVIGWDVCVCLCSDGSLPLRHGLVSLCVCFVFWWLIVATSWVGQSMCLFCVLMAHSRDAMGCYECLFVCVRLVAHCTDAMGRSVCLFVVWWLIGSTPLGWSECSDGSMSQSHGLVCVFVFWWLIVKTQWVGLCVYWRSDGSLSRRHGLVCVIVCVLLAHCHDAMCWSVC